MLYKESDIERGEGILKVKQFRTSAEIRRELSLLYSQVKKGELDIRKADSLKGLLYAILTSVQVDLKEREVQAQENLFNEIQQVRRGI